MCSLIVGIFLLAILLVGMFHGEISFWKIFILACIMFTMFGRYAHRQRQREVTREQLKYYKRENEEDKEE